LAFLRPNLDKMQNMFQLTFGTSVAQAKQQIILKFGVVKSNAYCNYCFGNF